jgi:hypothetical protein
VLLLFALLACWYRRRARHASHPTFGLGNEKDAGAGDFNTRANPDLSSYHDVPRAASPKNLAGLRREAIARNSPLGAVPAVFTPPFVSREASPSRSIVGPLPPAPSAMAHATGNGSDHGPTASGAEVQLLQAEIERLRAAYAEGAPPTYFSATPALARSETPLSGARNATSVREDGVSVPDLKESRLRYEGSSPKA